MNVSLLESIPVIIDDIERYGELPMSRCNYFSVKNGKSLSSLSLGLGASEAIPLFFIGLEGIITCYDQRGNYFSSAKAIQGFFDRIERVGTFTVEINDICIPNFVFGDFLEIGNLFRIPKHVFAKAHRFRNGNILREEFIRICEEFDHEINYSEEETISFSQWAQMQIELARGHMYKMEKRQQGGD